MPAGSQANLEAAVTTLRGAGRTWAESGERLRVAHETAAKTLITTLDGIATELHNSSFRADVVIAHDLLYRQTMDIGRLLEPTRLAIVRETNAIRCTLGSAQIHDPAWGTVRSLLTTRGVADVPSAQASVEDIDTWWSGLDDTTRALAVKQRWRDLGRVDGIDIPTRSECNEAVLVEDRQLLRDELELVQSQPVGGWWSKRQRKKVVADLEEKIGGLDDIEKRLADERAAGREAYLIDLDTTRYGTFRFSYGHPGKAKRVVTYVPGCGTSLGKAKGALEDSANLLETVERLQGPDEAHDTAVITSVYHITKPVEISIVGMWVPDAAAAPLARFQHSLRVTHDPVPEGEEATRFVGVHHSLGNVAASLAAQRHGYDVDAFVINGVGWTGAKHADELGVPEVYATLMDTDPLTLMPAINIPRRGPQPAWKKFGAKVFDSGPGEEGSLPGGRNLDSHFAYLRDDLTLLRDAEIVLGDEPYYRAPQRPATSRRR